MQRMALMGLVGVSMAGLGAGAWGLQARSEKKPELLFSRSREVLCAEKGMGELADERRSLDAAHLVIRSRVENRQLLVRGFMAGHWSTDQVLQETMRINREIPRCVAVLQLHYPDSTELDIARWQAWATGLLPRSGCKTRVWIPVWPGEGCCCLQGIFPNQTKNSGLLFFAKFTDNIAILSRQAGDAAKVACGNSLRFDELATNAQANRAGLKEAFGCVGVHSTRGHHA